MLLNVTRCRRRGPAAAEEAARGGTRRCGRGGRRSGGVVDVGTGERATLLSWRILVRTESSSPLGVARGAETDRDVCPRGGVGSGVVGPPQAPPEAARRRRRNFFALINGFSANIPQTCIQHNRLSRRGSARWPLLNVMLLRRSRCLLVAPWHFRDAAGSSSDATM